MDFITELPFSHRYYVILVIIDCLSKFAYFSPLTSDLSTPKVVDVFLKIVVSDHDIPQTIVSNHDKIFTKNFGNKFLIDKESNLHAARLTIHSQMAKHKYLMITWKCI